MFFIYNSFVNKIISLFYDEEIYGLFESRCPTVIYFYTIISYIALKDIDTAERLCLECINKYQKRLNVDLGSIYGALSNIDLHKGDFLHYIYDIRESGQGDIKKHFMMLLKLQKKVH